jgi:hypothetical protein
MAVSVNARRIALKNGHVEKSSGRAAKTLPLGKFLFQYLHERGVRHSFGVPGDFALPTYAWLDRSPIHNITMTHEPAVGFAADAYARVNGIGLAVVTYCVGGLNTLNAIAGAYAEKSPVVVVSGAPGRADRERDPLVHHKVKTFETQRRVYDEVTVASCMKSGPRRRSSAAWRHACGSSGRFTSKCRTTWPIAKFPSPMWFNHPGSNRIRWRWPKRCRKVWNCWRTRRSR